MTEPPGPGGAGAGTSGGRWIASLLAVAAVVAAVMSAPPATRPAPPPSAASSATLAAPAPSAPARPSPEAVVDPRGSEPARAAPARPAPAATAVPLPPAARRPPRGIPLTPAEPRLRPFAGLSSWIDVYDVGDPPQRQVARAADAGVQTLFVQAGKFDSPADVHDSARLSATIEAAHDRGLTVVTWYTPDFVDLARDFRRSQAAMAFVTPRGDRPDAFGLDIEVEAVADTAERTARLLQLSADLRRWLASDYPMAAIVLPPLQLDLRPGWWPAFPYAELSLSFDVFVPMSYSSFRGTDARTTRRWNVANVRELRRRAGDPDLPIHLAGGLANDLVEVDAFVEAAARGRVLGAGLYDLSITPDTAWPALRRLRAPPAP